MVNEIKESIERTIKDIEAKRENQTAVLKDRIVREKIAPYNADVDAKRARALAEIDEELNTKITELRNEYESKKQELVRLGEENKKEHADAILLSELSVVTVDYDNAIAKLKAQIAEIKE